MTQHAIRSALSKEVSLKYCAMETLEGRLTGLTPEQLQQLNDLVTARLARRNSRMPPTERQGEAKRIKYLTAREGEVLTLIARGYTRPDVAAALRISRNTAATHIASIYRKLEVGSIAEATMVALRWGFVT